MSTPTNCPFCGAKVANAAPDGSWAGFTCLSSWHRARRNVRAGQSHDCRMAEVALLTKERDELQRWKDSAMAVEAQWDPQAVARSLGIPIGNNIRPLIQSRVRSLCVELEEFRARLASLTDARLGNAVNEAARALPDGWMVSIEVERGAGEVILFSPQGVEVAAPGGEEPLLSDRIRLAVEMAKKEAAP